MINRSKAEAKARFKAKAKAKSKSLAGRGSGSWQGKIPGQPTKPGGEIRTPPSSHDGPPTQLKNQKAVEKNLAKVQLDKENSTTPKPKPEKRKSRMGRTFLFTDPCRICNVFGHWTDLCPYLKFVPYNVTKVGKGYEIHDGRHGRYAAPIYCLNCTVPVEHEAEKCPYDS
nr:uncharacterized protein LOC114822431 isoform X1 [Malus domestica]